jgi:autotransporter-associated beta strand protein
MLSASTNRVLPRTPHARRVCEHRAALFFAATASLPGIAAAQISTLYWDTNGQSPGSGAANGTWSASSQVWNVFSGGSGALTSWIASSQAFFSAGFNATSPFTVTVVGTQAIGGISFEEGNVSLTGGTLSFNALTTGVVVAPGVGATITSSLTGTGNLIKSGSGTLALNATSSNRTGLTSVNEGVLQISSAGVLGAAPASFTANYVTIANGGTLRSTATGASVNFLANNAGISLAGGGGTIDVATANRAHTLIHFGAISGNGQTLTKAGAGEYSTFASHSFAKLVVNNGLFRASTDGGFGAAGGSVADAIRLNGGWMGTSANVSLNVNRGITLGQAGGSIDTGGGGNLTIPGVITGAGPLTFDNFKSNALDRVIRLSGANSYSGGTSIRDGVVEVANSQGLGTGTVVMAGGVLSLLADSNSDFDNDVVVATDSTILADRRTPAGSVGQTMALGALTIGSHTLSTDSANAYAVIFTEVALTGNPTFKAGTHPSSFVLGTLGDDGVARTVTVADGTWIYLNAAARAFGGTFAIGNGSAISVDAPGALGNGFANVGPGGAIMLNTATTTANGGMSLDGGTLGARFGTRTLNNGTGSVNLVGTGGTFAAETTQTLVVNEDVTGTGPLNIGSAAFLPSAGLGLGTVTLSNAANSYTGATDIIGTLRLGAAGVIPDLSAVTVNSGGTFHVNGFNEAVGSLAGPGNVALGAGSAFAAGGNNFSTTYSGVMSGASAFIKAGSGAMHLTGQNTHTGLTTVAGGSLVLNGPAARIAGDASVSMGALLGGTGTVAGQVSVDPFGHVSPGVAGVGNLTVGRLSLQSASALDFDLGSSSDLIRVTTNNGLTLNGGAFHFTAGPGFGPGDYGLLDYAGSFSGSLANLTVASAPAGYDYQFIDQFDLSLIQVRVTPQVQTANATWAVNASGNWETASNWTGGVSPNSAESSATFGPVITASRAVTLDSPKSVHALRFNSASSYVLSGPGRMTLSAAEGGGTATVAVDSGNHTIATPLTFGADTNMTIAAGRTLILAGTVEFEDERTVQKAGPGAIRFSAPVTGGSNSALHVTAGTATFDVNPNGLGLRVMSGGSLTLNSATLTPAFVTVDDANLTVNATATLPAFLSVDNSTVNVVAGATFTAASMFVDSGGFAKSGPGTLVVPPLVLGDRPLTLSAGTLSTPDLLMSGGTFTHTGGSVTDSTVRLESGDVGVPALVLGPAAGLASYRFVGSGTIQGNIPARVSVDLALTGVDRSPVNSFPQNFTNAGHLSFTAVGGGGGAALWDFGPSNAGGGTFANAGTLAVGNSLATIDLDADLTNRPSGVMTVGSALSVHGNLTNFGSVTVGGLGTIRLPNLTTFHQGAGTLVTNDAVTLTGGTFNYTGGSVVGTVQLDAVLFFHGSNYPTLNLANPAGTGAFYFTSGGIVTGPAISGAVTVSSDGLLELPSSFTNAGSLIANAGLHLGPTGGGTLVNTGAFHASDAITGQLVNTGTATFDRDTTAHAVTNSGTVNISQAAGLFVGVAGFGDYVQTAGLTSVGVDGTLDIRGTLRLSGGTILLASHDNAASLGVRAIHYNGTTAPAVIRSTPVGSGGSPGALRVQPDTVIDVANGAAANDLTIGASVSGPNIIKTGPGALALSGNNSGLNDGILVQQGTLSVSSDENLGSFTASLSLTGGTLLATRSFSTDRLIVASNATVSVGTGSTLSHTGTLAGAGPLTKAGFGTLELAGFASGITTFTVSAGTLRAGVASALGDAQTLSLSPGTTFDTAGHSQSLRALTGSGSVLLAFGNTLTLGTAGTTSSFAGNISGEGYLAKAGSGTLTLSGNNAYTAATTVAAGTLRLGSDAALPNTTTVGIASGATLDPAGRSPTLVGLAGSGSVANSLAAPSTLHLLPSLTDTNVFGGSISGNVNVRQIGAGSQTFSGSNSFTGGVTVAAGTLAITGVNSFTGPINVTGAGGQIGILAVNSDASLGSAANALTLAGGRFRATASFLTARALSLASDSSIDVDAARTLTYAGSLTGSGGLTKLGQGTLLFTSANTYAAPLNISEGAVVLAGANGSLASSSLAVNIGASLTLDNSAADDANRLSDSTNVVLRGGTFAFVGAPGVNSTEAVGQLIPQAGGSTVSLVNGAAGTTTVHFASLGARGPGATVNFQAANLGSTNRLFFTTPPLVVGGDTVTNNLGAWATINGTHWGKYSFLDGVVPFAPSDYSNDVFTPNTHARLTASPAAPVDDLSIRTLNLAADASSVNVVQSPNSTLTASQGGLLKSGDRTAAIVGGAVRSSTKSLNVFSTGGDLRLSSVIGETVPLTDFVKAGSGTVYLGGGPLDTRPNTFTGVTRVQGGTLVLDKAQGTFAIPGNLEVAGGTLLVNRPGQINPNANVSLTAGVFNVNGWTETFATLTNDGGTLLFNGGTLNVDGITLIAGKTIVASELVAGSFMTISGGDNQIHPTGNVTVTGTTTFTGDASPGITIFAGATPGRLNLGGNLVFDGSAGTAHILTTAAAAGETPGTLDLGNAARTFNIGNGAEAVDMRISTRIQSGTLSKSGAGTLRLEAVNTYAGGTILSAGTLEAADPAALGTGPVTFSSTATLLLRSDAPALTVNNPITVSTPTRDISIQVERNTVGTTGTFTAANLTLGRSLTLTGSTGGTLLFPGNVTLQNNVTLNNSVTLDLRGAIAGAFAVTKTLPGTLVFGGASPNTYTGLTTINSGTLELQKPAGTAAVPGALTVNGPATVRLMASNQIADAADVTLNAVKGAAVLDLNNFNETIQDLTFTAGGTVSSGTGALTLTGDVEFTGVIGSGLISGNLALAGAGARRFTVADGNAANDLQVSAAISGTQGIIKEGPGRLLLDGINSFTGGITVNAGSLLITNDSSLSGNAITLIGGTLISSGSLSAPLAVAAASSVDTADSLTLTGLVSGAAAVTKTGAGTLTLVGANSLTGPLNVSGGVLAVPSAAALGLPSAITLSNSTFRATSTLSTAQPFTASAGGATLDVSAGQTLSLAGTISGAGPLTKTGPGALAMSGLISTAAVTTVSQGALTLTAPQTLPGGMTLGAAILNVNAPSSVTGPFTSSGAGVINHGTSTLTLAGVGNTSFTGNLRIAGSPGGSVIFARTGGSPSATIGASIQIDAGSTLALSGPVTVFAAAGAIAINNDSTIVVSAGANLIGTLTGTGNTDVAGGLLSTTVLRQTGLAISAGAAAVRPAASPNSPASTSLFTSLSITGAGALDLGNSSMILDYIVGTTSPLATLRAYLQTGRANGAWTGPGIHSASAAADADGLTAIAYVEAADLLALSGNATSTFAGLPIDATSVLLKYTYAGDANLNGRIDTDDYTLLDRGLARGGSSWITGDFTYDGQVTSADYLLIDRSLASQSGPLSAALLALREAQFGADYVSALVTSIPEPASLLAACGLALLPLTRRRYRRS